MPLKAKVVMMVAASGHRYSALRATKILLMIGSISHAYMAVAPAETAMHNTASSTMPR